MQQVWTIYPRAVATNLGNGWAIWTDPVGYLLGSGRTEQDAWRNATAFVASHRVPKGTT